MGSCLSICHNTHPSTPHPHRVTNIYPSQFVQCNILASDKNDDHFFFIKNEKNIDKTIDHFDETPFMNEMKSEILEHTLADLRNQKSRFTMLRSYDSADEFNPVHELDEEDEDSPDGKSKPIYDMEGELIARPRRSYSISKFNEKTPSKVKEEISTGKIFIEVQRGEFLHPSLLKTYDLGSPYIVVKVYSPEKKNVRTIKWSDVVQFETSKASDPLKPGWDEFFEYLITGEKKASGYSFGLSLYYKFHKDQTNFQVGAEQIFMVSSLLDQKVQTKYIDFKDPEVKGVLARVRMRVQFLHDLEVVKEGLVKEIKTKIERLMKVREKYSIGSSGRKERELPLYSLKKNASKTESVVSISSTHDNEEETRYFISEAV